MSQGIVLVVEHLASKCEVLNSNPSDTRKNKNKQIILDMEPI
jgi:hypothetical protein